MPTSIQRRSSRLLRALAHAVCALGLAGAPVLGQIDNMPSSPLVSFRGMWQAGQAQDYTVVQVRRFFARQGVTGVQEELRVVSNGTTAPDHELDYLGVVGEPVGSPLWTRWAQNYARHGDMFVEHGSFKVRDLQKVETNYTLHDFGPTLRAGRSARRVVVFPKRLDKAIWLLEVDVATLVPLYTAEYDASLRLLSEIEAASFAIGAQISAAPASLPLVTRLSSFDSAKIFMGDPAGLVNADGSTGEYSVDSIEVQVDPLNNRQTLILEYTDGIDQFFVTQTPGAADIFAGLPLRNPKKASNTIARYRDPAMSVLLFWDDSVAFQVAGRGSLVRLDSFAQAIYTKAILDS